MANERRQRAEQMRKDREASARRQRNLITMGIVVVVVALIALGGWAIKSAQGGDDGPLVTPAHTNASYGFDYTAADAGGTAGTDPVTVVLYEDFQCPVCQRFEQALGTYLDDLVKKGEITIEYRPFAILDGQSSTDYSTRAASAAMAVLDKGGVTAYKAFHQLLFAHQPPEGGAGLDDAALIDYAKQAGVTGIDSWVEDLRFGPWVKEAKTAGLAAGVSGTPTVQIDGKEIELSPAAIEKAIAAAKA